ncbi:MAG: hypothetical protein UHM08_08775 [Bacteroidales bacterium]|nr:hypothetical protein [Bacteroidales bacterium]
MCVIIYIPAGQTISADEINSAWRTNPDGAGYSYLKDGKVHYKRGYMKLKPFKEDITPLIGKYPLLLHFRISTSDKVNELQTHPYDPANITALKGVLKNRPAVCMNGTISSQTCYKKFNDTMSYIKDHKPTFKLISKTGNTDTLDIIEDATGSRWAMLTPSGVVLSKGFSWYNGKAYSNKNHLFSYAYYPSSTEKKVYMSDQIKKPLLAKIFKDKNLFYKVADHVEFCCNYGYCYNCYQCLKQCNTVEEVEETVNWNMFL